MNVRPAREEDAPEGVCTAERRADQRFRVSQGFRYPSNQLRQSASAVIGRRLEVDEVRVDLFNASALEVRRMPLARVDEEDSRRQLAGHGLSPDERRVWVPTSPDHDDGRGARCVRDGNRIRGCGPVFAGTASRADEGAEVWGDG